MSAVLSRESTTYDAPATFRRGLTWEGLTALARPAVIKIGYRITSLRREIDAERWGNGRRHMLPATTLATGWFMSCYPSRQFLIASAENLKKEVT